jgi:hypothetical protein
VNFNEAYKELKAGKCIRSELWDKTVYIKIWGPMRDVDYHRILLCYADEPEDQDLQWTPCVSELDGNWELYE